MTEAAPLVRLSQASIGYGDRPVLHDVDFVLPRGGVCVVLGPNGSGKSTLVKGILGLARRFTGDIEIFGAPASQFRDRHRIGYVPQQVTAGLGLPVTVREVVTSGRLTRLRRLRRMARTDHRAIDRAIDDVGLVPHQHALFATLSGGQQRRALIARALAGDPEVLLLDEPMAGVDARSQEALAQVLGGLVSSGHTVLLVAHELGPLAPLVTRVVGVKEGQIVYDGPPRPQDLAVPGAAHAHDDEVPDAALGRLRLGVEGRGFRR